MSEYSISQKILAPGQSSSNSPKFGTAGTLPLSPRDWTLLARKPPARSKLAAIRAMTLVFCIAWTCCMAALVAYMSAVYMPDHGVELKACDAIRASHSAFHDRTLL